MHKIHPLAGQGFNMTLRDAKILSELIKKNLDLGLNLDTVLEKFEIKRKNSNFVFAMGVDFLHEFFKLNNKYNMKSIDNLFKFKSVDKNRKFLKDLYNKNIKFLFIKLKKNFRESICSHKGIYRFSKLCFSSYC